MRALTRLRLRVVAGWERTTEAFSMAWGFWLVGVPVWRLHATLRAYFALPQEGPESSVDVKDAFDRFVHSYLDPYSERRR